MQDTVAAVSKRDSSNRALRLRYFSLHAETSPRGEETPVKILSVPRENITFSITSKDLEEHFPIIKDVLKRAEETSRL